MELNTLAMFFEDELHLWDLGKFKIFVMDFPDNFINPRDHFFTPSK